MQSSSRTRPFKPGLIGASPITDAICPRSSVRSERHRAKVEVAGAIPAADAILPLCLSSYRASFVNSYSSVQVRPEAPSGLWCNSSISPCEGDGPGANPGFLTNFDGPPVVGYLTANETERGCSSTATEQPEESPEDAGSRPAFLFRLHSNSCPLSLSDGPLSLGYR